ncbi:MAG: hypothetical protein M3Y20_07435 [Actinomycetota bacterium]|nr:hypothetical protein [Actinomycetota bacterium]
MSLDTDVDALAVVDLTAKIPCAVDKCDRPAEWRGSAVGCPQGHAWLLCDGHRRYELEVIAHNRALLGPRYIPQCGGCHAPLREPFITWVLL